MIMLMYLRLQKDNHKLVVSVIIIKITLFKRYKL